MIVIVFQAGDIFEGYELIEKLGSGGMGVVWRAKQLRPERLVALKLIQAGHEDAETRMMFEKEASLSAKLSHPNIVQVIGAGCSAQGILYISQVLVHGHDLRKVMAQAPMGLPLPVALFVASQVLYALQHAHDNGILHRDIKPENVLVSWDGQVQLTDFGIAKALDHSRTPTISTSIKGSAPYMAPEVIRGLPASYNADLWSFGVMLLELLTGKHPFLQGTDDERETILVRVLSQKVPDLSSLGTILPGLDTLLTGLLHQDPLDRYRFAGDVLRDLFRVGRPLLHEATALSLQGFLGALNFSPTVGAAARISGGTVFRESSSESSQRARTPSAAGQIASYPPYPSPTSFQADHRRSSALRWRLTGFVLVLAAVATAMILSFLRGDGVAVLPPPANGSRTPAATAPAASDSVPAGPARDIAAPTSATSSDPRSKDIVVNAGTLVTATVQGGASGAPSISISPDARPNFPVTETALPHVGSRPDVPQEPVERRTLSTSPEPRPKPARTPRPRPAASTATDPGEEKVEQTVKSRHQEIPGRDGVFTP